MNYGRNIKAARKAAGLTQAALAKKCGLATVTVRQYESGKREPRLNQLANIARSLGTTLYELVGDEYFSSHTQEELLQMWKEVPFSNESCDRIDAVLNQMTAEGQAKVADYAEDILPRYRRQDAPEPSAEASEGTCTTPPPEGTEGPPEGE